MKCISCPVGKYGITKETEKCMACPSGKYSNVIGATECIAHPTPFPTAYPTSAPTAYPTASPTSTPTTQYPTQFPTPQPTVAVKTPSPTNFPTKAPTAFPTAANIPTASPTPMPTQSPTPIAAGEMDGLMNGSKDWMAATNCGRGTYGFMNIHTKAKFCIFCPAGKYKHHVSYVNCQKCPGGKYSTKGGTSCFKVPTPRPTPMPTPALTQCRNGKALVASGWWGAGAGNDHCNLCKCNAGKLSCTKKICGIPVQSAGKKPCKQTKCKFSNVHPCFHYVKDVMGKQVCQSKTLAHKAMLVSHHALETAGSNHVCGYDKHSEQCKCFCY